MLLHSQGHQALGMTAPGLPQGAHWGVCRGLPNPLEACKRKVHGGISTASHTAGIYKTCCKPLPVPCAFDMAVHRDKEGGRVGWCLLEGPGSRNAMRSSAAHRL